MMKGNSSATGFGFALILAGTVTCLAALDGLILSTASLALALPGFALGVIGVAIIRISEEKNPSDPIKRCGAMGTGCSPEIKANGSKVTYDCRDYAHNNVAWNHVSEWTKKSKRLSRTRWPPRYP